MTIADDMGRKATKQTNNDKEYAFNVTKSGQVEVVGALRDLSSLKIPRHALPAKVTLPCLQNP